MHRQSAGVPRRAFGRQNVIGALRLVAISDRRFLADKQRAVVLQPVDEPRIIRRQQLKMLRRPSIRNLGGFLVAVDHNDLAVVAPCRFRGAPLPIGKCSDQLGNARHDVACQCLTRRDQPRRAIRSVFRLANQIRRNDGRISAGIGNDGDFRRPGEQIDTDAAEQHALGLGDKPVARPDQNICRMAREQTESQRGDTLNASERQDPVGAAIMHRIENAGIDARGPVRR